MKLTRHRTPTLCTTITRSKSTRCFKQTNERCSRASSIAARWSSTKRMMYLTHKHPSCKSMFPSTVCITFFATISHSLNTDEAIDSEKNSSWQMGSSVVFSIWTWEIFDERSNSCYSWVRGLSLEYRSNLARSQCRHEEWSVKTPVCNSNSKRARYIRWQSRRFSIYLDRVREEKKDGDSMNGRPMSTRSDICGRSNPSSVDGERSAGEQVKPWTSASKTSMEKDFIGLLCVTAVWLVFILFTQTWLVPFEKCVSSRIWNVWCQACWRLSLRRRVNSIARMMMNSRGNLDSSCSKTKNWRQDEGKRRGTRTRAKNETEIESFLFGPLV